MYMHSYVSPYTCTHYIHKCHITAHTTCMYMYAHYMYVTLHTCTSIHAFTIHTCTHYMHVHASYMHHTCMHVHTLCTYMNSPYIPAHITCMHVHACTLHACHHITSCTHKHCAHTHALAPKLNQAWQDTQLKKNTDKRLCPHSRWPWRSPTELTFHQKTQYYPSTQSQTITNYKPWKKKVWLSHVVSEVHHATQHSALV